MSRFADAFKASVLALGDGFAPADAGATALVRACWDEGTLAAISAVAAIYPRMTLQEFASVGCGDSWVRACGTVLPMESNP